jgi:hypothetical protein
MGRLEEDNWGKEIKKRKGKEEPRHPCASSALDKRVRLSSRTKGKY